MNKDVETIIKDTIYECGIEPEDVDERAQPIIDAVEASYIEWLKDEQAKRCSYLTREGDGRTCDCKFNLGLGSRSSEVNGCADIRAAIWVLEGKR